MVKYICAQDLNGNLVYIEDINQDNRCRFTCIGCGKEMSAVLGNNRTHHFRHKNSECSYESYLHKLSKKYIKYFFDKNDRFEIGINAETDCDKKNNCCFKDAGCNQSYKSLQVINLKDYYNLCEIESGYNGYIADVKLTNTEKPDRKPLFIEIYVSHECTPQKINSDIHIIEIKVQSEKELSKLLIKDDKGSHIQLRDDNNLIKFHNFKSEVSPFKKVYNFLVFRNDRNEIICKIEEIGLCDSYEIRHNHNVLFDMDFVECKKDKCQEIYLKKFDCIRTSWKYRQLKNCRICRHQQICGKYLIKKIGGVNKKIYIYNLNFEETYKYAERCKLFRVNEKFFNKRRFNIRGVIKSMS